jgi:HEAT repeat protein
MQRFSAIAVAVLLCLASAAFADKKDDVAATVKVLKSKSAAVRQKAVESLGAMGTDAVDASEEVIVLFSDKSSAVRQAAIDALEKINPALHKPLMTMLVDKDSDHKTTAIGQLGTLGADAAPAMPTMLRFYYTQAAIRESGTRLASHPFSASLLSAMNAIDPDNKEFQSLALSNIAPQSAENSPSSKFPSVQMHSIRIAANLAKAGKLSAGKLIKPLRLALRDERSRLLAVIVFGELGPDAKDALPDLHLLKTDPDQTVRDEVEKALNKIE